MRTITITANGCHDCELKAYALDGIKDICVLLNRYVPAPINNKEFHPDCPMKEVEGTTPFKPNETCLDCKYYYGCRDDCGGFGFEKVAR